MPRCASKVVLVTGAARGIGLASATALATEGAIVWLTDINTAELAARTSALQAQGLRVHAAPLDVRDESAWIEVLAHIRSHTGALHGLVNNAGITGFDPPLGPQDCESASLDTWRAVHATNAEGVFLGCKHAIAAMKPPAQGGSIVNISSRSGQVGIPAACAYASSKASVRNHTKSVALHCAQHGYAIRCNSIHPGAILTPMWESMLAAAPDRDAAIAELAAEVPLRRMGSPQDVAHMVVYLISDESAYVTGAEFVIDGGILAGSSAAPRN